MQQALYNSTRIQNANNAAAKTPAARPSGLLPWAAARWEMAGVLALMGSSAAYGVFALAHVGL